jgi:hypothetical protein
MTTPGIINLVHSCSSYTKYVTSTKPKYMEQKQKLQEELNLLRKLKKIYTRIY